MSELLIALTFDLDPDIFDESVAPSDARTKISWRCIEEALPRIREQLGEIAAAPASWFVRVDNQIEALWGRAAWLLEEYGEAFQTAAGAGDEIAWHPHLYRREGAGWAQETDPAALSEKMEAALTDMRAFGWSPRCGRIGEAYGAPAIFETYERLGIGYDSTAMAGRRRVDAERMIDWEPTPHAAFRPSRADHRVPGSPAYDVVELPMSMLRVRADYDAEPFLRYLDLSFHPRALQPDLDRFAAEASYVVTITHPSAILPEFEPAGGHGLISFRPEALADNLRALIAAATCAGRTPRFVTISELGDELSRALAAAPERAAS